MNRATFQLFLAAASLFASIGAASAQTPDPHYTGASATAMPMAMPQAGLPMPGASRPTGATMGGDMGRMEMMRSMMAGGMGMPFEHVEGHIASVKAELKITDAQSGPWSAFADTMRTDAAAMKAMHDGLASPGMPTTMPDCMAMQRKMMSGGTAMISRSEASMTGLYSALSPEQRTAFDQMMSGPMGMM